MPDGYEAYARLGHPYGALESGLLSWEEVANATGYDADAVFAWHGALERAGSDARGGIGSEIGLGRGQLIPVVLLALCELLMGQTTTPEECWFAQGWRLIHDDYAVKRSDLDHEGRAGEPELAREAWVEPLRAPYPIGGYLNWCVATYVRWFTGPLPTFAETLRAGLSDGRWAAGQDWHPAPNFLWPADRAWFVVTDASNDAAFVAGPTALIDQILDARGFDAWLSRREDSPQDVIPLRAFAPAFAVRDSVVEDHESRRHASAWDMTFLGGRLTPEELAAVRAWSLDDLTGQEATRLLSSWHWSWHIVAGVALLVREVDERLLSALWRRIVTGTWVVPQMCAVASIVDPAFAARASSVACYLSQQFDVDRTEAELSWASKTICSLAALPGGDAVAVSGDIRACDADNAGTIASGWRERVLAALNQQDR